LQAITPLDGRYRNKLGNLDHYLSEDALVRYRIKIELHWLIHLIQMMEEDILPPIVDCSEELKNTLAHWAINPPDDASSKVKTIENQTNHDVKAVEYYLRDLLSEHHASHEILSFIHFACTSEDINNLSYALLLKDVREHLILPKLDQVIKELATKTLEYAAVPMLSKTHGQPASPTTLGKEIGVFAYRLQQEKNKLAALPVYGKINGAVGNYNAHHFVFPNANWEKIAQNFIEERLGLEWNPVSTQIENHDWIANYCYNISLLNTISIDLCRDMWGYISFNMLKQKLVGKEVGSSTMPHKINPIDFENAEGNFGISTAISDHLARKLPISRFQRDLTDSTAMRSLNTMIGHHILALSSLLKGLKKTCVNTDTLHRELSSHWEVLAEPIQMLMRRYGVVDAYERLKEATRGLEIKKEDINHFIDQIVELPESEKKRLKTLSPHSYIGYAQRIAKRIAQEIL
jgi:adenylosuccinate lyase